MKKSTRKMILIIVALSFITVLNAQYTEIWNSTDELYSYYVGTQNTDSDAQKEIVFWWFDEVYDDHILVIDGATGSIDWDSGPWYNISYGSGSATGLQSPVHPRLIDFDSDGIYEILFSGQQLESDDSKWHLYSFTGGTGTSSGNYLPKNPNIEQNYPNPFNPNTTIKYSVATRDKVEIEVFNVRGQSVDTIVNDVKAPGDYSTSWDGTDKFGNQVSSGTYFYQLKVGDKVQNKKMILIK